MTHPAAKLRYGRLASSLPLGTSQQAVQDGTSQQAVQNGTPLKRRVRGSLLDPRYHAIPGGLTARWIPFFNGMTHVHDYSSLKRSRASSHFKKPPGTMRYLAGFKVQSAIKNSQVPYGTWRGVDSLG